MSSDHLPQRDFSPDDFEPGRIHRIPDEAPSFGDEMTPAIGLWDPKYPHNVGAAVRAASCFGAKVVVFSGSRVPVSGGKGYRLPREERMKGYRDIVILNDDRFVDRFGDAVVPVAVEVREQSEPLPLFEHPDKPLYIFGPEDGTLPTSILTLCHRFVSIPSHHCLNLGNAVNVILYDRIVKLGVETRADLKALGDQAE